MSVHLWLSGRVCGKGLSMREACAYECKPRSEAIQGESRIVRHDLRTK
jgi:hypothetical protein